MQELYALYALGNWTSLPSMAIKRTGAHVCAYMYMKLAGEQLTFQALLLHIMSAL